jgi:putative endonuclease
MQYKNTQKTELGAKGEQIACKYLTSHGYKILERNWRFSHKEIDIIAEKENTIHVVEVKTRATTFFERPQDAVTKDKQRFLIAAVNNYIQNRPFNGDIQFDIITVLVQPNSETIEYIPNAFYPLCR